MQLEDKETDDEKFWSKKKRRRRRSTDNNDLFVFVQSKEDFDTFGQEETTH